VAVETLAICIPLSVMVFAGSGIMSGENYRLSLEDVKTDCPAIPSKVWSQAMS